MRFLSKDLTVNSLFSHKYLKKSKRSWRYFLPARSHRVIINDTLTIPTDRLLLELGITIESVTVDEKETLKQKLKKHLGLCDKDPIIFLNDKVVIKKFKSPIDETVVKRERDGLTDYRKKSWSFLGAQFLRVPRQKSRYL